MFNIIKDILRKDLGDVEVKKEIRKGLEKIEKEFYFIYKNDNELGSIKQHVDDDEDEIIFTDEYYGELKVITKERKFIIDVFNTKGKKQGERELRYKEGFNVDLNIKNGKIDWYRVTRIENSILNEGGEDINIIGYTHKGNLITENCKELLRLVDTGGQFCTNLRCVYEL